MGADEEADSAEDDEDVEDLPARAPDDDEDALDEEEEDDFLEAGFGCDDFDSGSGGDCHASLRTTAVETDVADGDGDDEGIGCCCCC